VTTAVGTASGPAVGAAVTRGWIQSPLYDLAFFVLSPVVGTLAVVWALTLPGGSAVIVAVTFLLAIPHYISSLSFFLGDENREYYRRHAPLFFGGPILITLTVLALRGSGIHTPVMVTLFVWNVYHVSQQGHGILSIYRRLNNGPSSERPVARLAILSVNATMAFWYPSHFTPLYDVLRSVHPLLPWALPAVFAPVAAASLGVLAYRVLQRTRPIALPEGTFLVTSLLLFHPYLWVEDAGLATVGMLIGHFIQYLAVIWLLNFRKYARQVGGSPLQRMLSRMSGSPRAVVTTLIVVGLTIYFGERVTALLGAPMAYIIAWNSLALIHFYIDGLVWAFRNPFVRQSVGPYLMSDSRIRPV
jgi:hypothetical protein